MAASFKRKFQEGARTQITTPAFWLSTALYIPNYIAYDTS